MRRMKYFGMIMLVLCGLGVDVTARAQQRTDDSRENRDPNGGGRRGRGGFGGGGFGSTRSGGVLGLLRIDEIRAELNLDEGQQELIQALTEDLNEGRPEFPQNFRELTQDQQLEAMKQLQEWSAQQDKQARTTLATILEPDQFRRLSEISIQVQGVSALSDTEVAAKLNLSDEQKAQIASTLEQNGQKLRDEMRSAFEAARAGGGDFSGLREKIESLRKESDEQVLGLLNDEQRTAFEQLKGNAFEMPQRGFGGGFRGGQGFGGRRGGGGGANP